MPYDVAGFEITPKPLTVADVLNRAADLIERDGWYNGTIDGGSCAMIALNEASCDDNVFSRARNTFAKHIGVNDYYAVPAWNDAQPDGATVCAALRAAASAS